MKRFFLFFLLSTLISCTPEENGKKVKLDIVTNTIPQNNQVNVRSAAARNISRIDDLPSKDHPLCLATESSLVVESLLSTATRIPRFDYPLFIGFELLDINQLLLRGYKTASINLCTKKQGEDAKLFRAEGEFELTNDLAAFSFELALSKPGLIEIWVTIAFDENTRVTSKKLELFAHHSQLHFNHWHPNPNQKWITSGLYSSTENLKEIRASGIKTLKWVWGEAYPDASSLDDLGWVNLWRDAIGDNDFTGFAIDEFGTGSNIDQTMGRALKEIDATHPKLFSAAYSVGVSGIDMIEGFTYADLIISETYTADWRTYPTIAARYQPFIDLGMYDQTIAAIDLSKGLHKEEIRQQIAYIRTLYPAMPGIAFFGSPPTIKTWETIDEAIWDYYLRPTLLLQFISDQFILHNLGGLDATNIPIIFIDDEGATVAEETIAMLPGNQSQVIDMPTPASTIRVAEAHDRYTLIDYIPPTSLPSPSIDESEAALTWLEAKKVDKNIEKPLSGSPVISVLEDTEGNNKQVVLPIADFIDNADVTVVLKLTLNSIWYYGKLSFQIGKEESKMKMSISRSDDDNDLADAQARHSFEFTNNDSRVVNTEAIGLDKDTIYDIVMHFNPENETVRHLLFSNGKLLADSGHLLINGDFIFDSISFFVSNDKDSIIEWQSGTTNIDALNLTSGDSPYQIDGTVLDLSVYSMKE